MNKGTGQMNRKETGQGPKLKKPRHYHQERFYTIRSMKGASTILLQYLLLNMFLVLNNNLGEIGAKRICEVSMKKL